MPDRLRLPLLIRELTQQAALRRTYALRVAFGLGVLLVFASFYRELNQQTSLDELFGSGRTLVFGLANWLLIGIYLVQPALMAGAIAGEKQGRTLELLLVGGIRPGPILLQKLVARLLPMLSVLLLALPLLALSYAHGGLDADELKALVGLLLAALLQVGALGLLASAICQTPLRALALTYGLGALLYLGPVLVLGFLAAGDVIGHVDEYVLLGFLPSTHLQLLEESGQQTAWTVGWGARGGMDPRRAWMVLGGSALMACGLARLLLMRCATVHSRSLMRRLFLRLDRLMHRANRLTGGVQLSRRASSLPGDAPIAWRTRERGTLGRPQYVVRILLLVMLPVAFICVMHLMTVDPRYGWGPSHAEGLSATLLVVWLVAGVGLGAVAASALSAERASGTLDLLLITPLAGRQVVLESMRGVRRLANLAWPPLLALVLSEAYVERDPHAPPTVALLGYLLPSLIAAGVLLWLIRWVGMACGLVVRRRGWAVAVTLVLLLSWSLVPPLLAPVVLPFEAPVQTRTPWGLDLRIPNEKQTRARRQLVAALGPAAGLVLLELGGPPARPFGFQPPGDMDHGRFALAHALALGLIGCVLRWLVLRRADRWLGRPEAAR